jgi:molybdopterin-synthase adenylyltransferase
MSTGSFFPDQRLPFERMAGKSQARTIEVKELAKPHPAEPELFDRHSGVPGHHQESLEAARVVLVGAGGLNSWAALALLRSGVRYMTIIDPDLVDRTNLPRQLFFERDLGMPKATCLMENLREHAIAGAQVSGIPMRFEEAIQEFALPADLFVIGVDSNGCRLAGSREARQRGIPAIFTMLSRDGMRCQSFLQGPSKEDACLWCALPNLDPEKNMPCASAIITSCLLAAGFAIFFAHRALMGWPDPEATFNWREADLMGAAPDRTGTILKRANCPVCGNE